MHNQKIFQRRKERGVCQQCKNPVQQGHILCDRHLQRKRELSKQHYKLNKEKEAIRSSEKRQRARTLVLEHYGSYCACCKETRNAFLQIDHINNDGASHRKVLNKMDRSFIYGWLIKNNYPNGFQILCANCNWAKGKYGECPHIKERMVASGT